MKHVVIVGGGFAGVSAARRLRKDGRFQVTLISARPCFEYHAALYRSATGRSHLEVAIPLKDVFKGTDVEIIIDSVIKIDAKKRVVTTKGKLKYGYDELIVCPGVETAYFGIKGLPEFSHGLRSMGEAMELKNHLHAELTTGHKPELNYVVVGAGPSGVELAGELVSYLSRIRKCHGIKKAFHVDLVEASPRVLPMMPESFSSKVEARLKKLGVRIYTSTAVKGETADELQLPHGSINTHTVVWTAGMTNNHLVAAHDKLFDLGKGARAQVDARLKAADNIWVAGDSAGTPKTGWAQTAAYDGSYIAENLQREASGKLPRDYQPTQPVGAIPVGRDWCAVNLPGLQLFGYSGWLVRRYLDLILMNKVLPTSVAIRAWTMGSRVEETCSTCRGI